MKTHQLAINSVSTGHTTLDEALQAYAGAGFTNAEFYLPHLRSKLTEGLSVAGLKALLENYGIQCIGGFEHSFEAFSPPEQRAANHRSLLANARFLAELGATSMVVGTDGPGGDSGGALEIITQELAGLAAQLEDTGVNLCIEFNWSPIVRSVRTAVQIARESGAPNLGVLFDPAHYHCTPSKLEQLTAASVPFIKHVHVDDMKDIPGELSNCNTDRALPGQGHLDLRGIFGRLEQFGYNGCYSIEMFDNDLKAMPTAQAAQLMYDSLLTLVDDA